MKNFYALVEAKIQQSLNKCHYKLDNVVITESNRPDLGEYQFNGVMNLAKLYHENPQEIAKKIVSILKEDDFFKDVNMAGPGFINMTISDKALIDFTNEDNYTYPKNNKFYYYILLKYINIIYTYI